VTHLVQILLPLRNNAGKRFSRSKFVAVRDELMEKFGGLTAYIQSPAEGLWKPADDVLNRDRIVVYEVMVAKLDRTWWKRFRERLEKGFDQRSVIVRATAIQLL
jgi:hypothetical protein